MASPSSSTSSSQEMMMMKEEEEEANMKESGDLVKKMSSSSPGGGGGPPQGSSDCGGESQNTINANTTTTNHLLNACNSSASSCSSSSSTLGVVDMHNMNTSTTMMVKSSDEDGVNILKNPEEEEAINCNNNSPSKSCGGGGGNRRKREYNRRKSDPVSLKKISRLEFDLGEEDDEDDHHSFNASLNFAPPRGGFPIMVEDDDEEEEDLLGSFGDDDEDDDPEDDPDFNPNNNNKNSMRRRGGGIMGKRGMMRSRLLQDQPPNPNLPNPHQTFHFRWKEHQSHLLHAFELLLEEEAFCDVTLICDGDDDEEEDETIVVKLKAHKILLSACSEYFRKILGENPCKHPLIVLKGYKGWEIQALLDFMYKGEVDVKMERVEVLVKSAASLQIRGLTDSFGKGVDPSPPPPNSEGLSLLSSPPTKKKSNNNSIISKLIHNIPGLEILSTTSDPEMTSNSKKGMMMSRMENENEIENEMDGGQGGQRMIQLTPRRKQARPRRRSGDFIAQDLTNRNKSPSCSYSDQEEMMMEHEDEEEDEDDEGDHNHHLNDGLPIMNNLNTLLTQRLLSSKEIINTSRNNNNNNAARGRRNNEEDEHYDHPNNNSNDIEDERVLLRGRGSLNPSTTSASSARLNYGGLVTGDHPHHPGDYQKHVNDQRNNDYHHHHRHHPFNIKEEEMEVGEGGVIDYSGGLSRGGSGSGKQGKQGDRENGNIVNTTKGMINANDALQQQHLAFLRNYNWAMAQRGKIPGSDLLQEDPHDLSSPPPPSHNNKRGSSSSPKPHPHQHHPHHHHLPFPFPPGAFLPHPQHPGGGSPLNSNGTNNANSPLSNTSKTPLSPISSPSIPIPQNFFAHGSSMSITPLGGGEQGGGRGGSPSPHNMFSTRESHHHRGGRQGEREKGKHGANRGSPVQPNSSTPTHWPGLPLGPPPIFGRHRAQHSAPRGGPPRAWSNADLTEALHNVWNKKMTTSQASRIFGIPYNSLLMYVRGKYGKSLKLDLLKKGLDQAIENQNKSNNANNQSSCNPQQNQQNSTSSSRGGGGGGSGGSSISITSPRPSSGSPNSSNININHNTNSSRSQTTSPSSVTALLNSLQNNNNTVKGQSTEYNNNNNNNTNPQTTPTSGNSCGNVMKGSNTTKQNGGTSDLILPPDHLPPGFNPFLFGDFGGNPFPFASALQHILPPHLAMAASHHPGHAPHGGGGGGLGGPFGPLGAMLGHSGMIKGEKIGSVVGDEEK